MVEHCPSACPSSIMTEMKRYSITHCFYLLSIFMLDMSDTVLHHGYNYCFIECLDSDVVQDGKFLKIVIYFFPEMILYVFNCFQHAVTDLNTVRYIYFLMGLTQEEWMHQVLKAVYRIPLPLSHQAKLAVNGKSPGESWLRRICTPPTTVMKDILQNGRLMSVQEYSDYFKAICGEDRCIFETVWNSGKERETIYMLDLPFFGIHSDMLHLTSLSYLLSIEAVLAHEWTEMYPGTFYCRIEKFDLVFWAGGLETSEFFSAYMDIHLGDLCKKDLARLNDSPKVLNPCEMEGIIGKAEESFNRFFIKKYLFEERFTNETRSLRDLCRYQSALNVYMKRLVRFSEYPLTPKEIDNTSLVEDREEFVAEVASWFNQYLLPCTVGGVATSKGGFLLTQEDIDFIGHKATCFPLQVMLNVLLKYQAYAQWGSLVGFSKLIQLEKMFQPVDIVPF